MKKRILLLSTYLFVLFPFLSRAQFITISPNNSDFCSNTTITYTSSPPSPGNDILWQYADYSDYEFTGNELPMTIGFGTILSINAFPITNSPGGTIRAIEVDPQGNYVNAGVVHILSSVGNLSMPLYIGNLGFGSCFGLSVPPCFDPMTSIPWGTQRWAMWYKNGVPTGISSHYLTGPLTDSAWYEYKVRLTCGDTLTTGPFYYWQPSAPVITAQSSTTFCTGDTVVLQASSSLAIQYWTKDGVTIAGSNAASIKATQSGVYTAVIKTTSPNGASCYINSNPITVTVNPGAFITSTVNQACNGDSILLTSTAASSYMWKRNGNTIPGATSQTLWVKTSGNYQVLTTGLTCNASFLKAITVYANPTISLNPAGSISLCSGSVETIIASGNNISSYGWYRNGKLVPGATSAAINLTKTGTYKCVVSNVIGCTKQSSAVTVNSAATGALPSKTVVFQPGSDGKDSYITCAFGQFGANFGSASTMEVSNWHKYFRTAEKGYLEFDLSSLPANSPVISASLQLWLDTINQKNVNANLPNSIFFKRNTAGWSESTISWNNAPALTAFQSAAIPCSTLTSKSYVTRSILELVRHWSYFPTQRFGMIIQLDDYSQVSWASFASSDNSSPNHRPKLTIKYCYADIVPAGPLAVCTGGTVSFSTNAGPYTYQWYKNGVAIAGATTANYTATTAGDYFVTLTAASGCSVASMVKTVEVNAPPHVDILPAGPVNFCSGNSVTLSTDSLPGHTFLWKRNNVTIPGATLKTYTATQGGTYKVRVTNSCGKSATDSVVCTMITNPPATITAGGPVTFCAGQNVVLTANNFAGVTYVWRKNGVDIPGATAVSYTATQSGTYRVRETANGCSALSNTINVNVNCRMGEGDVQIGVDVFPHPVTVNSVIALSGDFAEQTIRFELYDMSGKRVLSFPATGPVTHLSRSGLGDGMYILKTMAGEEQIAVNKIILSQ